MIPLFRAEGIVRLRGGDLSNYSELKARVGEELALKTSALIVCRNVGKTNIHRDPTSYESVPNVGRASLLGKVAAER